MKKVKLSELQIKSFATTSKIVNAATVKGEGYDPTTTAEPEICNPTNPDFCWHFTNTRGLWCTAPK